MCMRNFGNAARVKFLTIEKLNKRCMDKTIIRAVKQAAVL